MLRTFSFNKNMVDKFTIFQLIALILRNLDFIMSDSDCLIEVSSIIWTQKYIFIGFDAGKNINKWITVDKYNGKSFQWQSYDIDISVAQQLTRKLLLFYVEHQKFYTIILCVYVVYSNWELVGMYDEVGGTRLYA